jgi:hypothetical protein
VKKISGEPVPPPLAADKRMTVKRVREKEANLN